MVDKLKVYLGITDNSQDALLSILIDNAVTAFEDYTRRDAFDYDTIIFKMVVEDYNRWGSEGISSLSFGSATEGVLTDYSTGLQRQIRKHKRLYSV